METKLRVTALSDAKAAKRLRWAGHVMLAMVVFGSVLPLHWSLDGISRWPLLLNWRDMQLPDFLQNVAAFAPIGVVYGASRDRPAVRRCVLLAIVVAIALQLIQLWLPDRTPRLTDAVANGLGLMAGLAFAAAAHNLRRLPGSPLPVDVAILLLLFCYFLLILLIERGAGTVMDQWLLHAGEDQAGSRYFAVKLCVVGFAVRIMIDEHHRAIWLFLLLCAACLLTGNASMPLWVPLMLLLGGLAAQWLPRRLAIILAIVALVALLLWEGLTPWIPMFRDMNWVPLKSLLMSSNLVGFVTLAWKLFCWSCLARLLSHWSLRGRTIMFLVVCPTAMIEFAQMLIASGFPDITDILLATGISGLVILVIQQAGEQKEQATHE